MAITTADLSKVASSMSSVTNDPADKQAQIKKLEDDATQAAQKAQSTTDKDLKAYLESAVAQDNAKLQMLGVHAMYSDSVLGVQGGEFIGDDQINKFADDVTKAYDTGNYSGVHSTQDQQKAVQVKQQAAQATGTGQQPAAQAAGDDGIAELGKGIASFWGDAKQQMDAQDVQNKAWLDVIAQKKQNP